MNMFFETTARLDMNRKQRSVPLVGSEASFETALSQTSTQHTTELGALGAVSFSREEGFVLTCAYCHNLGTISPYYIAKCARKGTSLPHVCRRCFVAGRWVPRESNSENITFEKSA